MRTVGLRFFVLALAVGLGPVATAGAEVFTVNIALDDGVGSLRQAILDANASGDDDDEIVFDLPDDTVIQLLSPLPEIAGDVVLNAEVLGVSAQGIVIRGDGVDIFRVGSGTSQLIDLLVEDGQLQIAAGATLSFEQTLDGAFADTITEEGGLEKLGPASLTLSGSNDYSGGTAVREGTLIGDTDAIPGDVVVDADARLSLDIAEGDDETFSGLISGEGNFEKAGEGILRFDGQAHSYEGGTSVSGGTLVGDTTSLQGDIANDATLVFQVDTAGEFAGDISGTGSVVKAGLEALTLSGENSFSGGLSLTGGSVVGDSDSIPGDVSMEAATQLVFDQATDGTHAGNIDGEVNSSVEKQGAGALTLAGSNDYGGGTTIVDGSLIGDTESLPGNISFAPEAGDSPALVFDQGFDASFDGVVDSDGDVTKRGTGNLSFSQTQTYTGATTIEQGRLLVDANLGGAGVQVEALGALGGNGSVAGGVTADGLIGPGPLAATATESIGFLEVDDVVFEPASVFEVHASESPNPTPGGPLQGDRLSVTGEASIDGADVRVILQPGTYETAVNVDILTAPSILGTGFNELDEDFAFLILTLTQTGTSVNLVIEQDLDASLTGFAETPNQLGVAAALEEAEINGSNGDLDTVLENFFVLFEENVPPALDDSAGEALTGFPTLRLAIGDRFHGDLHERVRSLAVHRSDPIFAQRAAVRRLADTARAAASGRFGLTSLAAAGPAASLGEGRERFGVWLDGYGLFGNLEGSSGAKDLDYTVWGVSAGLDWRPAAHWVLGFAGGWAGSDLEFQSLSGTQRGNTAQGALYGGYASPRFRASASLRAAWNALDSKRRIVFGPDATLDRSAKADFDGWDYGGRFETGLNLFRLGGAVFEPLAAFSYARVEQEGFSESGAGSLDLSVKSQHVTSCESGVGARIHGSFQIDESTRMTPELRGRWTHEFCDLDRRLSARIGGTPGASYVVRGAERPRDGGVVGVSWTVTHADRLHFFAEYDAVIDSRLLQHSVAVGLEALF